MTTDRKLSLLLDQQIPDYVEEYYPLFVVFVTKYFQWLEQQGNPQEVLQTIHLNRDIDTVASSLAIRFLNQYIPNLPQNYAADRNVLVKYFRDFYERKGSINSFKFFFKAFFNDEIEIQRPQENLFKLSDATWIAEKSLRVNAVTGNVSTLASSTIYGSSSGARAVVNEVIQVSEGRYYKLLLQRDSIVGTFSSSESIIGYNWDFANDTSTLVVTTNTLPLQTSAGRTLDSRSQLSSDQILQDSYYFQNFSYVVRSHTNRELWYNAVLRQLHPAGHTLFNHYLIDQRPQVSSTNTTFARSNSVETTVKFFEIKDFYVAPGFTFDRLANFRTGTSATTSVGAISYDVTYSYPGNNVTFALQKGGDNTIFGEYLPTGGLTSYTTSISISNLGAIPADSTVTSSSSSSVTYLIIADNLPTDELFEAFGSGLTTEYYFSGFSREEIGPGGATWDKAGAGVAVDEQIVLDGYGVDTSVVTQLFHTTSNVTYTTSTALASGTIYDATSVLIVLTWMKDFVGNAAGELQNALVLSLSSTASLSVAWDGQTQLGYRYLSLGNTLLYPDMVYYESSSSLNSITGYSTSETTTSSPISWMFKPANANRAGSFSRATFRVTVVGVGVIDYGLSVSSNSVFNALATDHLNLTVVGI